MEIRKAEPRDVEAITACAVQAYAIYVPRIGKKPAPMVADFQTQIDEGKVDVLIKESDLRGFIVHYPCDDHVHIENVALLPADQGKGYGRTLIAFAEDRARQQGFDRVELYTNQMMTENLSFYPALGYVEIDRRREDGFDRVYYRKELT